MGQPVKIADLAKKMIRLSGLTVNRDIQIVYTGLRPGEKLYEELLASGENTLPTHHKQIMRAKLAETDWDSVSQQVEHVCDLINEQTNLDLVRELKRLVPEFLSNNSEYEQLDAHHEPNR
jgi:FlaA1/EpsC-like NDP-sugar epimerase